MGEVLNGMATGILKDERGRDDRRHVRRQELYIATGKEAGCGGL
jgi:hypothetical protein